MNVIDWIHYLSKLNLKQLKDACFVLDELSGIIQDDPAITEFDVICQVADEFYEKAEHIASLEDEKRHACTCGGNCEKILCLTCKKVLPLKVDPTNGNGEEWYRLETPDCLRVSSGRLYMKCNNYEPRGVVDD